jgi:hypothetical protein
MSFSRPFQCDHSRIDLIWPDVPFKVSFYCIRKHHDYLSSDSADDDKSRYFKHWRLILKLSGSHIYVFHYNTVSVTSSFYILDGLHVTYLSLGSKLFLESVRREQQSFFSIKNLLREKSRLCVL